MQEMENDRFLQVVNQEAEEERLLEQQRDMTYGTSTPLGASYSGAGTVGLWTLAATILVFVALFVLVAPLVRQAGNQGPQTCVACPPNVPGEKGETGDRGPPGNCTKADDGKDGRDGINGTCIVDPLGVCPPPTPGPPGESIKGDKGDPGNDGLSIKGDPGNDGVDGANCWEAVNGTSVLDCIGEKGDKGDKGDTGPAGFCNCSANVTTDSLVVNQDAQFNGQITCAVPIDTLSCLGASAICQNFSQCNSTFYSMRVRDGFAVGGPGLPNLNGVFMGFFDGGSVYQWLIPFIRGFATLIDIQSIDDLRLRSRNGLASLRAQLGVTVSSSAGPVNIESGPGQPLTVNSGGPVVINAGTSNIQTLSQSQVLEATTDFQIKFGGLFRVTSVTLGQDVFVYDSTSSISYTDGVTVNGQRSFALDSDLVLENGNAIVGKGPGGHYLQIGPNIEIGAGRIKSATSRLGLGHGTGYPGTGTPPTVLEVNGIIRNEELIGGGPAGAPIVISDSDGLDLQNTCLMDSTDQDVHVCDNLSVAGNITTGSLTLTDVGGDFSVPGAGVRLDDGAGQSISLRAGGTNDLVLDDGVNTVTLRVTPTGLEVNGDVDSTGACCTSDMRAKRDVRPVTPAASYQMLQNLDVISYQFEPWFENSTNIVPGTRFDGVSAQQVDRVLPQAIRKRPFKSDSGEHVIEDLHQIRKDELVPHLLNAIKFLGARLGVTDIAGSEVARQAALITAHVDRQLKTQALRMDSLQAEIVALSANYRSSISQLEAETEQRALSMAEGVIGQYFDRLHAMEQSVQRIEGQLRVSLPPVDHRDEEDLAQLRSRRSVADLMRHFEDNN